MSFPPLWARMCVLEKERSQEGCTAVRAIPSPTAAGNYAIPLGFQHVRRQEMYRFRWTTDGPQADLLHSTLTAGYRGPVTVAIWAESKAKPYLLECMSVAQNAEMIFCWITGSENVDHVVFWTQSKFLCQGYCWMFTDVFPVDRM